MVYELPKFGKLLGSDGCLEFRVSFCFHNGIADAIDYIITTANCRFARPLNVTFGSNRLPPLRIELFQRISCLYNLNEKFIYF